MNLLELQDMNPSNVYSACQELIRNKSEKVDVIASLVSLFRLDTNSSRPISDALGVNYETFYQVFGCTFEHAKQYPDLSKKLAKILNIKDSRSIEIIFNLARGNSKTLYKISQKSTTDFPIRNLQITDSLVQISQKGKEALRDRGEFLLDQKKLYFLSEYVDTLNQVIQLTLKIDNFEKFEEIEKNRLSLLRKNSLTMLTSACWRDENSIKELAAKLTHAAQS